MKNIKALYFLQYLLILGGTLEVYDAILAKDEMHIYIFSGLALFSLTTTYLVKKKIQEMKLSSVNMSH